MEPARPGPHHPRPAARARYAGIRGALAALIARMDIPVRKVVRAKEPLFRELRLDEKDVGEDELLDAMAEHPILINRPIVVVQNGQGVTARLCRPSELVKSLLAEQASKP